MKYIVKTDTNPTAQPEGSIPFFSVIVPTKNRSALIGRAIQSVLDQTFADWEVVVVDNDDSSATADVLGTFADNRIRSIRTGGLNMPDNWERGFDNAVGRYQLVLEDKSVLKPRALKKISDALEKDPAPVVSWPQDMFNDLQDPPVIARGPRTGDMRVFRSEEILEMLQTLDRGHAESVLPRGLNSCMSRELIQKIRSGPVGRICPPVSPDYTMAYLALAYSDRVLNIFDCLTVYGSCAISHGRRNLDTAAMRVHLFSDFGIQKESDLFEFVPLKVNLTTPCLFNDYLRIRDQVGLRLTDFPLNLGHFFIQSYRDLLFAESLHVDKSAERAAWHKAFSELKPGIKKTVSRTLFPRPTLKRRVKKALEGTPLLGLYRAMKFTRKPVVATDLPSEPLFSNPLDYVRWEASS